MTAKIFEWYGYSVEDKSAAAQLAASSQTCPFLGALCKKRSSGGVCSITPTESNETVIICPVRMYFKNHQFLADIAKTAFAHLDPLESGDRPALAIGTEAVAKAAASGQNQIGVFGQGWGGELKLPPSMDGGAAYSVDFTLVAVSPEAELLGMAPVEVQSIDITNSNDLGVAALKDERQVVPTTAGLNWENVSKRILPQLIVKGLMLQGEALSTHGIYFVTPEPVFQKIAMRLGGMGRLREIPPQPGAITFVRLGYVGDLVAGVPLELGVVGTTTISTSDMSIAFISPQNLPPAGSYEKKIRAKMGLSKSN
jgi:hypothetical protein